MRSIDLNADVGEGFADWLLFPWITSANVACGFHAGDAVTMAHTLDLCRVHRVAAGAHPGLPDREGFGRAARAAEPGQVRSWVTDQVSALAELAGARGIRLRHVKLHGALYHMAGHGEALARETVSALAALDRDLTLVVPPGSVLERVARASGLAVAREGFPERGYLADGTLAPRDLPGAVIHDPGAAARRAVEMARDGRTTALDGSAVPLEVETLCVHGDAPGAASVANAIRLALTRATVRVAPL